MTAHRLSRWQRFIRFFTPRATFARLERESRAWRVVCDTCGHERSVWDLGGIRAVASGSPQSVVHCPRCDDSGWHSFDYRP